MPSIDLRKFIPINDLISSVVKNELVRSGHKFEGDLERSFKSNVTTEFGHISLHATALDYIMDLEDGISPQEFDESRVDVEKLDRWVKFKRSQGHKVPGVNRLIKLWKRDGYELGGALAYSKSGRVNLNIKYAIDTYLKDYFSVIDEQVFKILDDQLHTIKSGRI